MNNLVFNNTAKNLKAAFYGRHNDEFMPVALDENGLFLFSPLSVITVTATDLDIRHLNSSTDSVTVTATAFDIRNLTGARDSVAIAGRFFLEQNLTQTLSSGTTFLLTRDISSYSQNSFFLRNTGGGSVTVALQIAPVDNNSYYINATTPQSVTAGNNLLTSVTAPIKFARLSVQASTNVGVVAYYNGRA